MKETGIVEAIDIVDNDNLQIEGPDENSAKEYKKIFNYFWESFKNKDEKETDEIWLKKQLMNEMPELSKEKSEKYSNECIKSLKTFDEKSKSLKAACEKGKSKNSWLTNEL